MVLLTSRLHEGRLVIPCRQDLRHELLRIHILQLLERCDQQVILCIRTADDRLDRDASPRIILAGIDLKLCDVARCPRIICVIYDISDQAGICEPPYAVLIRQTVKVEVISASRCLLARSRCLEQNVCQRMVVAAQLHLDLNDLRASSHHADLDL